MSEFIDRVPELFEKIQMPTSVGGGRGNIDSFTQRIFAAGQEKESAEIDDTMVFGRQRVEIARLSTELAHALIDNGDSRLKTVIFKRRRNGKMYYGVCAGGHSQTHEERPRDLDQFHEASAKGHAAESPVPGKVVTINYKEGEVVPENSVVVILESMKMQFEVKSDEERVIEKILVSTGQQVEAGTSLLTWQE